MASFDKQYYIKDHLGSVRLAKNLAGTVVSARNYSAFGETIQELTNAGKNKRYRFTGKERDDETNNDYFGARYYDSEVGRWNTVDPMSGRAPENSSYLYCLNNPLKHFDPDGKWPWIANQNNHVPFAIGLSGFCKPGIVFSELKDVSNVKFMPALNIIAKRAPSVFQYLKNTQVPIAFVKTFTADLKDGTTEGLSMLGNVGILLSSKIKNNTLEMATVILHESVHNLGGIELDARGVTAAAGLSDGSDVLRLLSVDEPSEALSYLLQGLNMSEKEDSDLCDDLNNFAKHRDAKTGDRIKERLKARGKKWLDEHQN
jgi:RHS repeat-associated protein